MPAHKKFERAEFAPETAAALSQMYAVRLIGLRVNDPQGQARNPTR